MTPEEIEALAAQPKSASSDAGSVTTRDASEVADLLALAAATDLADETNDNGGPRSGWHATRPGRASFPGAHR